jgi:competence protein ComEC
LGLVARPVIGEQVSVAAWLLAAGAAFVGAAVLAPTNASRGDPLAGLTSGGRPNAVVEAVAPARLRPGRGPAALAIGLVALGAVALGVGWGSAHAHRVAGGYLAAISPARVVVEGSLRTDPSVDHEGWSAVVDARLVSADGSITAVRESVWASGEADAPDAVRGDRVRLEGRVSVPGEGGFGSFLSQHGLVAELEVDEATRLGPATAPLVRAAQSFRALVGTSIRALFPPREAGLLMGLALGDDSQLDPAVERDFRASGLSHMLVVSGENVAMVLAPVLALAALLHLSRWPRFALGLGTVVFFVVLTGAEPSVLRAGVMAGLTLVGVFLGRPRSTAVVLSAAVFALLIVDPALVWSVGFQLSVAATASMLALASPIGARLRFLPGSLALATGATLAAQLGVTPVLLYHFHEVPLSTVVANVLAFPAVSPALLLGLAAAATGLVWQGLGRVLAGLAILPMRYLELLADRAARAPIPWITGGGGIAALVVGLAIAVGVAWWIRSGRRVPRTILVLGIGIVPLLAWSSALSAGPPSGLRVRFFDVGQGDSALLTSPAGVTMLVDGGPDPAQMATELVALGVKRLDLVVASHPHADHVVGLPEILARIPVGLLLEPGCSSDSPDAAALAEAVRAEHVPVRHPRAGDVLVVGDVRLEVLSPDRCWAGTESDANNDAIVLRASLGEDSILFATEPEEPAQQVLLDSEVDLTADVLKVPHHGAATSIEAFFQAVHAEIAVVSVGPNTYGHPVPEILAEIRATGAEVFRTDRAGDVTITFAAGGLLVDSGA